MTGGWIEKFPDDVKAIAATGHDLGNHSENHKHLGNGAKYTKDALESIILGLKEKGYELVPISELIYTENYEMDHEDRLLRNISDVKQTFRMHKSNQAEFLLLPNTYFSPGIFLSIFII